MNIKDYSPKSVNVEAPLEGVVSGSGTYKEIVEKVYDGTITPLVCNDGTIVGINYDTKLGSPEDQIQGMIFSKKYEGHNVLAYFERAYSQKMSGVKLEDVDMDAFTITRENNYAEEDDLPDEVEIDLEDLEGTDLKSVKKYLKNKYGHYLSGLDEDPNIDIDDDVVIVSNISWGRKAY